MAEKIFTPEFGPNGAVLNAPGVTPERRQELERAYLLFPPGTPWRTQVKTLALVPLAIAGMFVCAWFTDWLRSMLTIINRDLGAAAVGFLSAIWVGTLFQRPARWRREIETQPHLQEPPLIWRLAIDIWHLTHLALMLAAGSWMLAEMLNAFESDGSYSSWPLFSFLAAVYGLTVAFGWVRRILERRHGLAIPGAF